MPSFVDQLWKPLEWIFRGKGGLEVAAIGAGMLTVHWLCQKFANKDADEKQEQPVKCLKPENFVAVKLDSDLFELKEGGFNPFRRLHSFKLELDKWEVSMTESESIQPELLSLPPDPDSSDETSSIAMSDVTLSVPESQFCTRGLLLEYRDVPSVEMPKNSSLLPSCCCWKTKGNSLHLESRYGQEPVPLCLVNS